MRMKVAWNSGITDHTEVRVDNEGIGKVKIATDFEIHHCIHGKLLIKSMRKFNQLHHLKILEMFVYMPCHAVSSADKMHS